MTKIIKYVVYDIVQNKMLIAYTAFLLAVSFFLLGMETDANKGLMSLLNIILLVIPLVSIIFSTIHFYNSYEFIELLLAQPINRTSILLSEYFGVATSLILSYLVGVGIPIAFFAFNSSGISLLLAGISLTMVFVSLAFLAAVLTRDKAKGIGLSLMLWFYFSLIYDGIVLFILFTFSDYPLDKAMLAMISLNPIDLGRIIIMLQMDISALMGYTGATFKQFFGTTLGGFLASFIMILWIFVPLWFSIRLFKKKDL